MNKITTSIAEMVVDEDGIVRLKIKDNAYITIDHIKENHTAFKQLLGDNQILLLIDSIVKYKFTKQARIYTASKHIEINRVATAFLVDSFAGRIIVNFYIWFNRPSVTTRIFTSEEKALNWLKSFYILPGTPYIKSKKEE